jgi:hypothetical protein
MLAAVLVMLTAGATAHAKMEMRTFPVLAGLAGVEGRSLNHVEQRKAAYDQAVLSAT